MKKKIEYNKIKALALLFLLLLPSISVSGQKDAANSPATYEQMKSKSFWQQTTNAAGLQLDNPWCYTELSLRYSGYSGNFHRPQEGQRGGDLDLNVEGALSVGEVYTWGKFNYTRSTIKDANFNASIIDPFRGMPYMTADTNRSEWRNQTYDLAFKVATPKFWDHLSLGLEGGYQAISGAKQRDIRTENYYYQIKLRPALVYSINDQHHIGANFEYFNLKEEANPSNVNAYVDQQYYALYGLGNSVSQVGSGRAMNYEGNNVGGGLQYNYQGAVNLLVSGSYNYKVEDVNIGFTLPRSDASVKDHLWNAKLQLFKDWRNLTHFVSATYTDRSIDGIESITQYDNTTNQGGYITLARDIRSTYKTKAVTVDYDLTMNREREYIWKFGAGVKYTDQEDIYLLPRSEKSAENIAWQVRAKRNFFLSRNTLQQRLLLAADYSLSHSISGGYNYNGSHSDYPVVVHLEQIDVDYLTAGFYSIGCSATYSQKIKETILANLFGKVEFRYTHAQGALFSNRRYLGLTVGCNF